VALACLARIDATQPVLNAFAGVDSEKVPRLQRTDDELRAGPDCGPSTKSRSRLKDLIVAGVRLRAGSLVSGESSQDDARSGGAELRSPVGAERSQLRRQFDAVDAAIDSYVEKANLAA
jgi:hypothetical protein